jgi:hypothetical protein
MMQTYSLAEVAAMYLPPEWDGVLWLSRRLSRGEIPGYKVGRVWRMTDDDVTAFIDSHRKPPKPKPDMTAPPPVTAPASFLDGLSPRSRARLLNRRADQP